MPRPDELEPAPFRDLPEGWLRLPGVTWETGNMYDESIYGLLPSCDMDSAVFDDKLWCDGPDSRLDLKKEHPVLREIFYSDACRRLQAIEQLTLTPEQSTVPNTASYSRFEGLLGGVLFIRRMADKHGLSEEECTRLQVQCLLSDFGHTVGSHKGDHMFQGIGGPEDLHDEQLWDYLEVTGINDILRKHALDPKDVIFPDEHNLAEAPRPDLCVDRIDYVVREANRSNDVFRDMHFSVDDFTLTPDGIAAITSLQRARLFAEADTLVSELNWGEPVHRVIESLLLARSKLYYVEGGAPDVWIFDERGEGPLLLNDIHPRDLMYVTDPLESVGFARLSSKAGLVLDRLMHSIAQYQRRYIWPLKRGRQIRYMEQFADQERYDQIVESGEFVPMEQIAPTLDGAPPLLRIMDIKEAAATKTDEFVDLVMDTPFKLRQSDPLVQTDDGFARLSELDPSYKRRLAEHHRAVTKKYTARLFVPDETERELVRSTLETIDRRWEEHLRTTRRLTQDEFRGLLRSGADHVHGRYSFMFFEGY